MNEAEKYPGVMFHFQHRCIGVNAETGEVMFENGSTAAGDTVIATDGAGSVLRASFANEVPSFRHEEVFLEHGYKELHIPPGDTGSFQLEKNALHIWPRRQFMMIALPNFDGSFTCTLFLAKSVTPAAAGASIQSFQDPEPAFDRFSGEQSVRAFFENQFPDAVPLMPSMVEDFFNNPTGNLGTVKCWPWNIGGKVLLLGDSAHAMVPFYGQGMNCAFEDVRVLAGLIDDQLFTTKTQNGQVADIDWNMVFNEYCGLRKPNTDAIQEMAEENFFEMRDATADLVFQRKRELETKLEQTYPEYFSKYSMVTFREDLPYKVAKERGIAQDELLTDICSRILSVEELNLQEIMDSVRTLKAGV
jgi:kynurenine 3-monooxygenase